MAETTTQDKTEKRLVATPISSGERGVQLRSLEETYRFCQLVANSKEFRDIHSPEQAMIRLQAGAELGLTPIWSITNIMVVNGRPTVWGDSFRGLIQSQPDFVDLHEWFENDLIQGAFSRTESPPITDDLRAVCKILRGNRSPVIQKFSVLDAKRAMLWGKSGPWTQYPLRMLQMRALSWAGRDAYSDKLRGLGVREELADSNGNGKPVAAREVKAIVLPDETVISPQEPPASEPERSNAQEGTSALDPPAQDTLL